MTCDNCAKAEATIERVRALVGDPSKHTHVCGYLDSCEHQLVSLFDLETALDETKETIR